MFDTKSFWNTIELFLLGMVILYFLLDVFVLRKMKDRSKSRDRLVNILLVVSLVFLFATIIKYASFKLFMDVILGNLVNICVLILATTGIVFIFKTSITTNFAQGMLATFGAFFAAKMIQYFSLNYTSIPQYLMVAFAMIGGAFVAFILGLMIDVFIIRKAKKVTSIGKQMITMGLVLVLSGGMPLIFGSLPLSIPRFSETPVNFTMFGNSYQLAGQALYALIITVVLLVALFSALRFTKWGLGVRATASNEVVANMMGVNTRVITAMTWAIAGGLGAVAAVLLTPVSGQVLVALMVPTQVNGFMAAILGGFSSFVGPILGSILIPVLAGLLYYFNYSWYNAIVYVVILLIVLVKPLGLFGKRIAKKV